MSIVLTRTQNIRSNANLDKNEIRGSRYGVLDAFLQDKESGMGLVDSATEEKFFSSIGSTFEVPVINYDGGVSIGSARSATISDRESTSAMQSVSASIYSFGFTMTPAAYHNNEIGYQRDFEAKFWNHAYAFLAAVDSVCATTLNTHRTQVWNNALSYGDPTIADIVVVPNAKEMRALSEVSTLMEANDYFKGLRLIGNGGLQSLVTRQQQFGKFNQENRALGLQDRTFHYSNRIADAEGHEATFYATEVGQLGIMSRVDTEALARRKSAYAGYEWDVINFPILNLPVGTMYYQSVGDYNAIAGAATAHATAVMKEHFGFSVDLAVFGPYASAIASRPNPIMKFGIQAAA